MFGRIIRWQECLASIQVRALVKYNPHDFFFSGPQLPLKLMGHSMVPLGNGQAIIGGYSPPIEQSKIYSLTCTNRNCMIELMSTELSVPKDKFVAIPIPDRISGCIMGGNDH